jgi:hypothetical protein
MSLECRVPSRKRVMTVSDLAPDRRGPMTVRCRPGGSAVTGRMFPRPETAVRRRRSGSAAAGCAGPWHRPRPSPDRAERTAARLSPWQTQSRMPSAAPSRAGCPVPHRCRRQRIAWRRKRQRMALTPSVDHATRTEFGHPRSSLRLRTWAAMVTSVVRASSLWKRSPSPMTCFQRANWPSTRALSL